MDCRLTSSRPRARQGRAGFTILEMLFAMGITGLIVIVICSLSVYSSRNFVAIANYSELDHANRLAMDTLTTDVRQANYVHSASSNHVVLAIPDPLNPSWNGFVVYSYSPSAGTLMRGEFFPNRASTSKTLLTGCERLQFTLGQRNFNTNYVPFRGLPLNSPGSVVQKTAKVLDVSWLCSRKIFGVKANTESVQTARVVIRNQQY